MSEFLSWVLIALCLSPVVILVWDQYMAGQESKWRANYERELREKEKRGY